MELVVQHGRAINGPTAGRPTNAYPGAPYFDTDLGIQLVWNGSAWLPPNAPLSGTTGARPAATTLPAGTMYFNTSIGQLQYSDGALWLDLSVEDEHSSSSNSSSSSTSSNSSSSTSSSSSSTSSESSSSQSA